MAEGGEIGWELDDGSRMVLKAEKQEAAQRDYSDTLAELADGIRGLHPNAGDNSPVTPDGWISCSERMPPTNVAVLVCVNGVVQKSVFCWDGESWGDWYDEYDELAQTTFTHWMPLPEPPQEVNRG
ncbi:DUF551 domain-containing protein [Salmonella enterica]|nr:DUF551 domain-containing protein [Salmonella enterica]EAY1799054.1 DUF551 domain-containing protein [Salmonella enterica]EAY1903352.1 DUF551 domain-containing protein [Salmonella enterica]EAY1914876.1 DUF551 domain-containing protein [Salmonella enterica]EAZ2209242.1 DUF551 domain-containing protein [Salmonella enterica]